MTNWFMRLIRPYLPRRTETVIVPYAGGAVVTAAEVLTILLNDINRPDLAKRAEAGEFNDPDREQLLIAELAAIGTPEASVLCSKLAHGVYSARSPNFAPPREGHDAH